MNRFLVRNWDESRWEHEILRDERRINGYFTALLSHIDLPGEEKLIAKAIAGKPELLADDSENILHCWSYLAPSPEECDEEEDPEYEEHPAAPHAEQLMIELIDSLACQWNETYISTFPEHLAPWGVCAACFYGRLLARIADFADAFYDQENDSGLRITLAKFVLSDIDILCKTLLFMCRYQPDIAPLVQKHTAKLDTVRHRISTLASQVK